MIRNNYIVIDLNKVAYARHYYENQHSQTRRLCPKNPTSFGDELRADQYTVPVPGDKSTIRETEIETATRLGIIDRWFPVTRFQFANTHCIEYTGEKAQAMWKAWNEKIFKKK